MIYRFSLQERKRLPLFLGIGVLTLWMALNAPTLFASQHGGIRFVLTTVFALLILVRPAPRGETDDAARDRRVCTPVPPARSGWRPAAAALLGATAVIAGLILPAHQIEWIGILLLAHACLSTGLPPAAARNVTPALLVLFWANPLPVRVFGTLQGGMQIASVQGAEWLLHLVNTRVWADGMILNTGTRLFEVPAWCSGMRTATTVFILALALGILRRFRVLGTAVLIAAALAHALVLNIARIAAMVYFAPLLKDDAGLGFLHDTGGLLVVAGVFLVYVELLLLEHLRHRHRHRQSMMKASLEGGLSEYPLFWHRFIHRKGAVIAALFCLAAAALLIWRSRPLHRAHMLQDVVIALRDQGDIAGARRLAPQLDARLGDDLEWRFTRIRLDLLAGEAQHALEALDTLPVLPPPEQTQHDILQAYALLRLGRLDEAAVLAEALPAEARTRDPRIAIIMAEMALRRGDPAAVAANVIIAGRWDPNAGRIRNLYPYLRIHRQWDAMAATDVLMPYDDPAQAFSVLEALMNLNKVTRVAAITLDAAERWPLDPRVLEPLYFMAVKNRGEWERLFMRHLLRTVPRIEQPETLYELLYKCFQLARPDLAWSIHRHMEQAFPGHPVLAMSIAEYGDRWFVFRRHHLGLPAASDTDTIDLKPFFTLGTLLPGWQSLINTVPHGRTLAMDDTVTVRKAFLQSAIAAFAARSRTDGISGDLHYLYAQALERGGRLDLAREQLHAVVRAHPEEAPAVRALLSEMYERKGAWVQVYETLRPLLAGEGPPPPPPVWPPVEFCSPPAGTLHLRPLRRLIQAQLELRLHLAAVFTARKTVQLYPYSPQAQSLLVTALLRTDESEAALQQLSRPRVRGLRELDLLEAEALFATERFSELTAFSRSRVLPPFTLPPGTRQNIALPPAEISLLWHRFRIPSETAFAETARILRGNLAGAGAGLTPLFTLWLEAYEDGGGDVLALERWMAVGRDRMEQATALHQLTLLLCRRDRFADALPAARAAVAALPALAPLWHILISLTDGDPDVIALARRFCPDDADIWLAELVIQNRSGPEALSPEAVRQGVAALLDTALADGGVIHPAGLTRAAEYLSRCGLHDEAARISGVLKDTDRGLLPACIIGMQTALHARDRQLALQSTTRAIRAAIGPMPELHENLVYLKSDDHDIDIDSDMVDALRQLRKRDPANPLWAQMLGYIRFQRGGWERVEALFEMNAALARGATNQTPFLIAAEAARLLRNYDRAADILRRAREYHPDDPVLINNLAYTLAQNADSVPQAVALIPALADASRRDLRIRDTLAVVHLRAGDLEQARRTVAQILSDADPGSQAWFRAQMHLAEIAWRQGHDQVAISMLEHLLQGSRNIPDEDIVAAHALFIRITATATPIPLE